MPMDPTRAREILQSLADGRDPATGATFPPDSPYQQADTVRALYAAQTPIPQIATAHGRSRGAITSRLVKLGLLQDDFPHPAYVPRQPSERSTVPPPATDIPPPGPPTTTAHCSPLTVHRSLPPSPPRNPKPDDDLPF